LKVRQKKIKKVSYLVIEAVFHPLKSLLNAAAELNMEAILRERNETKQAQPSP
jgi:hypothetical protein